MRYDKIVEYIEDALDKECYIPALALTLIIPDICAKYDYPDIYNNKGGNGKAYAKWYDENIRKYEIVDYSNSDLSKEKIEEYQNLREKTTLKGEHCWKLRCGLLHNGWLDIDDIMGNEQDKVSFQLTVSEGSKNGYAGSREIGYSFDNKSRHIVIELDLFTFCKKILSVFKNAYLSNKEFIEDTEDKALNFIDKRLSKV